MNDKSSNDEIVYPFFFICCLKKSKQFVNSGVLFIMITSIVLSLIDIGLIISISLNQIPDFYFFIPILDICIFRIPKLIYSFYIF